MALNVVVLKTLNFIFQIKEIVIWKSWGAQQALLLALLILYYTILLRYVQQKQVHFFFFFIWEAQFDQLQAVNIVSGVSILIFFVIIIK